MSKRIRRQVLAGTLCAGTVMTPALAEMDLKTRGSMQHLHESMLLAEQNLQLAIEQKDIPRASLANDLLFTYKRLTENAVAPNPCIEALDGLTGTAMVIAFSIHPVTKDPSDRFSAVMRPPEEILAKTYDEGWVLYRSRMAACEEAINYRPTSRLLPEKMPLTR